MGSRELWVLGMAIALPTLGIHLAKGGGITQKVSQNLGLRDGIVRIYNQNAATYNVYAILAGFWTSDADGKGVYKTGEQIITSKVTIEVDEAAKTKIINLSFNDESAVQPLQELQQADKDADIYSNGELTVDFPEDVKIPIEPNQITTAVLSGSSLKFSYCSLDSAIAISERTVCSRDS